MISSVPAAEVCLLAVSVSVSMALAVAGAVALAGAVSEACTRAGVLWVRAPHAVACAVADAPLPSWPSGCNGVSKRND